MIHSNMKRSVSQLLTLALSKNAVSDFAYLQILFIGDWLKNNLKCG